MADIRTMLDEEYQATLEKLSQQSESNTDLEWELKKLSELHKQRMEEKETFSKIINQDEELRLKKKELALKEEERKTAKVDRIIDVILKITGILVPVTVSSYWMAQGLIFEKKGTFTSRTVSWLSNHTRLFKA